MNFRLSKSALVIFVFLCCKCVATFFLPIVEDESYYAMWSEFPALGYLDHPPMVAWLGLSKLVMPGAFGLRFASLALSFLGILVFNDLCQMMFANDSEKKLVALMLFAFSAAGCAFGSILTPDTPQFFFWIVVLHEVVAFQKTQDKIRLVSAGISFGLGLMSKYTLILLLPVLILVCAAKKTRLNFPSFAILIGSAFICFAPHFFWNASHDWLSFRFLLKRGFTKTYDAGQLEKSALPAPTPSTGSALDIANYFFDESMLPEPPKPELPAWQKLLKRMGDLAGSLAGLWGFLILPLAWSIFFRRETKNLRSSEVERGWNTLFLATWIPVVFFGIISLVSKVEGNWLAPYIIGASLVATQRLRLTFFATLVAAFVNILLLGLVVAHCYTPIFPIKPKKDRLLRETAGNAELAALIQAEKPTLLLFDTFQNGGLVHFYAPDLKIAQWPGMTRVSEFLRQTSFTQNVSLTSPKISLLTFENIPPQLPGYQVTRMAEIRNCARTSLHLVTALNSLPYVPACPTAQTLRRWFLVTYSQVGG